MVLHDVLRPGKFEVIYPVLCGLRYYTLAIDDYLQGRPEAQTLGMLAQQRNFVQHDLMSLTNDDDRVEVSHECSIYTLCRLAATIYSLLVIFPLPTSTAPFSKLGIQIKTHLSSPIIHHRWNETPGLMIWITVMASIAAVGSRERSWYVSILDRLVARLQVSSWHQFKQHLQKFLRYGSTSDLDGVDLWKDIQQSSPFST